jgi:hypothetical protein
MKSDDNSNLFSADTNGFDITTDITKSDDGNLIQLETKLCLLNKFFNAGYAADVLNRTVSTNYQPHCSYCEEKKRGIKEEKEEQCP